MDYLFLTCHHWKVIGQGSVGGLCAVTDFSSVIKKKTFTTDMVYSWAASFLDTYTASISLRRCHSH